MDQEEEIADLKARVANLEGWQKRQNGAIERVDDKLDGLKTWIMGLAAGVAIQLMLNAVG